MTQMPPFYSRSLADLSDADVMRLIERLRNGLDVNAGVEVSIMDSMPRAISSLAMLTRRHPEIDWDDSRLISSADIVMFSGAEIGFRRQDGCAEIHLWHDGQSALSADVSEIFCWEVSRLKPLAKMPAMSTPTGNNPLARLKALQISIRELPLPAIDPAPLVTAVSDSHGLRIRSRWKNEENIAFALTTGIERPGANWTYQGLGVVFLIAAIFLIGAFSILVQ